MESWHEDPYQPRILRVLNDVCAVSIVFVIIKVTVGIGQLHSVGIISVQF